LERGLELYLYRLRPRLTRISSNTPQNHLANLHRLEACIDSVDEMANETVALDLGLPALSSLAHKASDSLHSTICSYPPLPDFVRDLLGELEALNQLLDSLEETVNAPTEADLSALAIPLRRCGEACRQFGEAIEKCLLQPSAGRTKSLGWLKIKYMGENIDGFKRILSAYKMTIIVALTDESL
jgi:hypothetical protein